MRVKHFVLAILVAVPFALPSLTLRGATRIPTPAGPTRHVSMHPNTQSRGSGVLLVDGATTPDQIPDDLAYRHFLAALASTRNASQADLIRRDSFLRSAHLSIQDHSTVIQTADSLKAELDAIDVRSRSTAKDTQVLSAVADQRKRAIDLSVGQLRSRLTSEGAVQFEDYLRTHVKRNIKRYAWPADVMIAHAPRH